MLLILIGVVAGMIAGISPCVVPVLPVIFVAGATGEATSNWRRSLSIVAGLVVSFSVLVLAGAAIISGLHLPSAFLRDLGVALLIVVGIGLLVPPIGQYLERPFARVVARGPRASSSGFVIGLALGLVFVPCAGPVLSTIIVLGAKENVNAETVFVTLAFSLGAAVPLCVVALAGGALVERVRSLRQHGPLLRRVGGAVFIVMALAINANVFNSLQTAVPGYTSALQQHVEGSASVRRQLDGLKGTALGSLGSCTPGVSVLQQCGLAPKFTDVTAWLNTPGDRPLTMAKLRGKVVLIDSWTYSCINCERSLPHVEAWYQRYKDDGLVVVGVHTPEFAFEHVVGNVKAAAASLGVTYPIAIDNDYGTWDAYANEYWPAEYLIDADGVIRHVDFGEGDYGLTETLIRRLLVEARPGLRLPPRTDVANRTPTTPTNPETYVGFDRLEYDDNAFAPSKGHTETYQFPRVLESGTFAFAGEWTEHAEEATAGAGAKIELSYEDHDVYLVMGGSGTVTVSRDGVVLSSLKVGGVPRLYALLHANHESSGVLVITFTPGVKAYDFTFG